jgi:hypothetical protein
MHPLFILDAAIARLHGAFGGIGEGGGGLAAVLLALTAAHGQ